MEPPACRICTAKCKLKLAGSVRLSAREVTCRRSTTACHSYKRMQETWIRNRTALYFFYSAATRALLPVVQRAVFEAVDGQAHGLVRILRRELLVDVHAVARRFTRVQQAVRE